MDNADCFLAVSGCLYSDTLSGGNVGWREMRDYSITLLRFCKFLNEKEGSGWKMLIVFLLSCGCLYSDTLSGCVVGLSEMCDNSITL